MASGTTPPGTIRLTSVVIEWAEQEHTNPRFLAAEVAAVLRQSPPEQLLDRRIVAPALFNPITGPGGINAAALADYFEGASQGTPPDTIRTSTGTAPAGAVLIARHWINHATKEAAQRAAFVAGLVLIANDGDSLSMIVGGTSSTSTAPTAPPSGSEPGYLQMRQAQQRKEGDRSAAAQLDEAQTKAQRLERKNTDLVSTVAAKDAEITRLQEENEQHRRGLSAATRAMRAAADDACELEARLEAGMGLAEFMNADNPLSPPDGRELINCWLDLTQCGTTDPTITTGLGWRGLAARWLKKREPQPAANKVKWFGTALTTAARKKGGQVAARQK